MNFLPGGKLREEGRGKGEEQNKRTHLLSKHISHPGRLASTSVQLELQLEAPFLPIKLLHGARVSIEALGRAVSGSGLELLLLGRLGTSCGPHDVPLLPVHPALGEHPSGLVRLPARERVRPIEGSPARRRSGIEIGPGSCERGQVLGVVAGRGSFEIGLRGERPYFVRVLHVAARLRREIVRAALWLRVPELHVARASRGFREPLLVLLLKQQIRHVDVGRVPAVHRRRKSSWRALDRRGVVVVRVAGVPRAGRRGRRLAELPRPQSRTLRAAWQQPAASTRLRLSPLRRHLGLPRRLDRAAAARLVTPRAQPGAAGGRVGAEIGGEARDRVEDLREASRRGASHLLHPSSPRCARPSCLVSSSSLLGASVHRSTARSPPLASRDHVETLVAAISRRSR